MIVTLDDLDCNTCLSLSSYVTTKVIDNQSDIKTGSLKLTSPDHQLQDDPKLQLYRTAAVAAGYLGLIFLSSCSGQQLYT